MSSVCPNQYAVQRPPHDRSASTNSIETGIAHIEQCYQTGHEFLGYGRGIDARRKIFEEAQKKGIPRREASRYTQFARFYTKTELTDLYAAFRAAAFVFSFTHFRALMAVKDKAARTEMARKGIEGRLGTAAFRRLMQRTFSNHIAQGGRKPELLQLDDEELEVAVMREKENFCNHLAQILSRPRGVNPDLRKRLEGLLKKLR